MEKIDTFREEMRVMGEAVSDSSAYGADWKTPEFWSMVIGAVTNIVAVAVMFGWVNSSDAETITKSLAALLGAAQVIVVNAALVWKFISARLAVKQAVIAAQLRYAETVAVARIKAAEGK